MTQTPIPGAKQALSEVKKLRGWLASDPSKHAPLVDALNELTALRLLAHKYEEAVEDAQDAMTQAHKLVMSHGAVGPYTPAEDAGRFLTSMTHVAITQVGLGQPEASGQTAAAVFAWMAQLPLLDLAPEFAPRTATWLLSAVSEGALASGDNSRAGAYADAAAARAAEGEVDPRLAADVAELLTRCRDTGASWGPLSDVDALAGSTMPRAEEPDLAEPEPMYPHVEPVEPKPEPVRPVVEPEAKPVEPTPIVSEPAAVEPEPEPAPTGPTDVEPVTVEPEVPRAEPAPVASEPAETVQAPAPEPMATGPVHVEPEPEPAPTQVDPTLELHHLAEAALAVFRERQAAGDRAGTLSASEDVVALVRQLAATDEAHYGPTLVSALQDLAEARRRGGDWWGSRGPAKEAKQLAKRLGV